MPRWPEQDQSVDRNRRLQVKRSQRPREHQQIHPQYRNLKLILLLPVWILKAATKTRTRLEAALRANHFRRSAIFAGVAGALATGALRSRIHAGTRGSEQRDRHPIMGPCHRWRTTV